MQVSLRPALIDDSSAIAQLVHELGYRTSARDVEIRLSMLLVHDQYFLTVAVDSAGALLGLVNAERRLTIESGTSYEITGLVVSAHARRLGVGASLVTAAETWARSHGARIIRVRSNVVRPEAHAFYAGCGYALQKTQHCYTRPLPA